MGVIDGRDATHWDIWPRPGVPHWLAVRFVEPVRTAEDDELIVHLEFRDPVHQYAKLACFRLSVTSDESAIDAEQLLAAVRDNSLFGPESLAALRLASGDAAGAVTILNSQSELGLGSLLLASHFYQKLGKSSGRAICERPPDRMAEEKPATGKIATHFFRSADRSRRTRPTTVLQTGELPERKISLSAHGRASGNKKADPGEPPGVSPGILRHGSFHDPLATNRKIHRIEPRSNLKCRRHLSPNSHYFTPTTIESGPLKCSTRVCLKPASRIQLTQSAPV